MSQNYLPQGGHIEVITGPMFSGKTEELIRRLKIQVYAGKMLTVIKPDIDDIYATDVIVSHDGENLRANNVSCSSATDILKLVNKHIDIVAIDEAQFFGSELVPVVEELANMGKRVIVVGVDTDYRGLPFEPMGDIMALAEVIDKMTGMCECGKPATRVQRYTNQKLSHWDEETFVVYNRSNAGVHQYEPRCRKCHRQPPKLLKGSKQNAKRN